MSTKPQNKEWILNGQIVGTPTTENFTIRDTTYNDPKDGEFVIKTDYFSVDPYLRGQFNNPDCFGKVVQCYSVGTVIESKTDKIPVGTILTGISPAQLYITSADVGMRQISKEMLASLVRDGGDDKLPLSFAVGCLGMPGASAHVANKHTKAGDVVFINASAGMVGSMLGRLAKLAGAKLVIGAAGGPTKCALATQKYGYDVCIDYKEFVGDDEAKAKAFGQKLKEILAENDASAGINVYYDMVGSWMSDAIFGQELIAFQGEAVIIGAIDEYNTSTREETLAPRMLSKLIYKAITVYGFIVFAYFGPQFPDYYKEFEGDVVPLIKTGQLNSDETMIQGFENISEAFIGLFAGRNVGKMVVKV